MNINVLAKQITQKCSWITPEQAEELIKRTIGILADTLEESQNYGIGKGAINHVMENNTLIPLGLALHQILLDGLEYIHASVKIDPLKTVRPNPNDSSGKPDPFYVNRRPPEGFVYPEKGTEAIALCNYEIDPGLIIRPGTKGVVNGLRLPGSSVGAGSRIGCCLLIRAKMSENDRSTLESHVIPWDCMEAFGFFHPETDLQIGNIKEASD